MTLIIGLTGGIGSGKTAVSDYFATQGITIVDADVIAHKLTQKDSPLLAVVREQFGDWSVDTDGNYDRAAMRQYVFANPDALAKLNAIMHPAIRQAIINELQNAQSDYVILSVPLLFETRHATPNLLSLCYHLLVVDVSPDVQIERASKRDGNNVEQIRAIINRQIDRNERLALAKQLNADIVQNEQTLAELHQQLENLHQKYTQLAQQHRP